VTVVALAAALRGRRRTAVLHVLVVSSVLAACAGSAPPPPVMPTADEPDSTIGPGDTFEVNVYGEADLSGKHRIGADGTINFPLVGRINVGGKGPGEIADAIRTALAEKQILRDPHVSVFLLEQAPRQIAVVGSVVKPGSFPIVRAMSLIEAISLAGGLTPLASGNSTIVTRRVEGQLKRFKVPVDSISEGRSEDFQLQAGDIVFVPERIF
jgi:protein involved in polysaccharide export with SLBB domain